MSKDGNGPCKVEHISREIVENVLLANLKDGKHNKVAILLTETELNDLIEILFTWEAVGKADTTLDQRNEILRNKDSFLRDLKQLRKQAFKK